MDECARVFGEFERKVAAHRAHVEQRLAQLEQDVMALCIAMSQLLSGDGTLFDALARILRAATPTTADRPVLALR